MEVWILYGDNIESTADLAHEVRRFLVEGERLGVDVKVYRPEQFDLIVTDEVRDSILIDGTPVPLPDFLYPYFNHNDHSYFSLAVVRQLERMGVFVYNSASTIETVRDKMHTHQALAESHLPTPKTMLAKFPADIDLIESALGFPVIAKTLQGALGTGVFLLEDRKALNNLMALIGEANPNLQLIFQEFIASSRGRDLRVFVVDGQVIACMERTAKEGDFKANFSAGGSVKAFPLDPEIEELAVKTAKVLNIQIAGVDLLFTNDAHYTICEANTFPGFKGLEMACKVNVPELIFKAMRQRLDAEFGESGGAAAAF